MGTELIERLADKTVTKEELLQRVMHDCDLLPEVVKGVSSSKAAIRYGCAKVLMDLSEERPGELYPYLDEFVELLDSKYRILTWTALTIIANLAKVDKERKIDAILSKYYSYLDNDYLVTVVTVVGNSAKIAIAKPYLTQKITAELLRVDDISVTPHLTEECKRVILEKTIDCFDAIFDQLHDKAEVLSLVKRQLDSPRTSLKAKAKSFLEKRST